MAKGSIRNRCRWFTSAVGMLAWLALSLSVHAQSARDSLYCRLQTRLEDAANLTKVKENTAVIDTLTPLLAEFPEDGDPAFRLLEAEYRYHIGYAAFYRSYESASESDNQLGKFNLNWSDSVSKTVQIHGSDVRARGLRMRGMFAYFMEDDAYEAQNHYDDAYREWMDIPGKDSVEFAVLIQCMGQAASKLGEYERAIELYQQTLEIRKRVFGERHQRVGVAYWNLGNALGYSDRFEEATKAYEEALAIIKQATPDDLSLIADIQNNLATNYSYLGKFDLAIENHQRALAIQQRQLGKNSPDLIDDRSNLALANAQKGKLELAFHLLTENQSILSKNRIQQGPIFASANLILAKVMILSGRFHHNEILTVLNDAIEAIGKIDPQGNQSQINPSSLATMEPLLLQQILLERAQFLARVGDQSRDSSAIFERCLGDYLLSSKLADQLRQEYRGEEDKLFLSGRGSTYLQSALGIAHRLWQNGHEQRYVDWGLNLMESCKSQFVLEFYRRTKLYGYQDESDAAASIYDSLRRRATELDYEIQLTKSEGRSASGLQEDLLHTQAEQLEIARNLEGIAARVGELEDAWQSNQIATIQGELDSSCLMVTYTLTDSMLFVVGISKDNFSFREEKIDNSFLKDVEVWRSFCNQPIEDKSEVLRFGNLGQRLFEILLAPELHTFSSASQLILIPDGKLGNLPFEALPSPESCLGATVSLSAFPYLIYDYSCQYAPSISIWLLQKRDAFDFGQLNCLGIAWGDDPTPHLSSAGELPTLQGTEEEVTAISDLVEGIFLVGQDASESTFKNFAPEYGILHLALHAQASQADPQIFFPNGGMTDEDGILHFHEIFSLKLHARMAVLSACETGIGKVLQGEGIQSMSSGFAAVGVPTLLMTLWEVNDQTGRDIVLRFYDGLRNGMHVDRALRAAKLSYLENAHGHRASPFFWASYMASGNMDPVVLATPRPQWMNLLLGLVGTLCILIAYRIYKKNRKST